MRRILTGGIPPGVLALGQPDLPEVVFRALGLKGSLPLELDRQFQLGITVEELTKPEFAWLKREQLGTGGGTVAAGGAGQFGFGSLRGSNDRLVVNDRIIIANSTAATVLYALGMQTTFPSGAGSIPGVPRDGRSGVGSTTLGGAVRMGTDPAPVAPGLVTYVSVPAGGSFCWDVPFILAGSGHFFSVICQTANVRVDVAFYWRERVQQSSET